MSDTPGGQITKKASFDNKAIVWNPKEQTGAQSNNLITYGDLKINVMAQALLDRSTQLWSFKLR